MDSLASPGTCTHDGGLVAVLKGQRFVSNGLCKTLLFLAPCLLVLASCAGDLDEPTRFMFLGSADGGIGGAGIGGNAPAPAPACVTEFFASSCAASVCHSDANDMDLVSPGVELRLVDKPSAENLKCGGRTLVSSTGGESLLLKKLTDSDCGEPMPFGGMATTEQIACVRGWIDSLAAPVAGEGAGQ
jgi:hypothetical protein